MAIRVVEFSSRGYKIRKIFAKESIYPKEILNLSFGLMASCQKMPKFDFFFINHLNLSQLFFSLKSTFFVLDIF